MTVKVRHLQAIEDKQVGTFHLMSLAASSVSSAIALSVLGSSRLRRSRQKRPLLDSLEPPRACGADQERAARCRAFLGERGMGNYGGSTCGSLVD